MDCSPPGSTVLGTSQEIKLEWVTISFSRRSPLPRDQIVSPALQADSTMEPSGKPLHFYTKKYMTTEVKVLITQSCPIPCDPMDSPDKNTEVSCCFLPQGIFLIQGSDLWLLSPVLASGFFTTSTTWEAQYMTKWLDKVWRLLIAMGSSITNFLPLL